MLACFVLGDFITPSQWRAAVLESFCFDKEVMLHSAEKVGVPARLADLAAKVDLKQDSEDDTTPYSSLGICPHRLGSALLI